MLNELEVTVEGEETGGNEDNEEEGAWGFPAKALENGVWDQGLPAAVVLSGEAVKLEAHEDEDGVVGGGDGVLFE